MMVKERMFGFRLTTHRKALPAIEEGYALLDRKKIPYTLHRKPRRRKIAMYIEPSGRLRFIAPLRTRTPVIDDFLYRRQDWILDKILDLQNKPSPHFPAKLCERATVFYLGQPYRIKVTEEEGRQTCSLNDTDMEINLPHAKDLSAKERQEEIRLEIILWYKKQARLFLNERTKFWANTMQLHYRSLKISSPLRQWGSCSARNDIRLNWRVLMAAPPVIDYLIVHELVHIVHKNHSLSFWKHVGHFIPDYKVRQQILKRMDAGSSI